MSVYELTKFGDTLSFMAGKEPEYGPTAAAVAANVGRLRSELRLSYTDVSDRLAERGWPLSPVAVRRIEKGQRKVSPDDLTALAIALRVSPVTLLMPNTESRDDEVELSGVAAGAFRNQARLTANVAWQWLRGDQFVMAFGDKHLDDFQAAFILRSAPDWLRTILRSQMDEQLAGTLSAEMKDAASQGTSDAT